MKNLTLSAIIIFLFIISAIFAANLITKPTINISTNSAITNNNQPSANQIQNPSTTTTTPNPNTFTLDQVRMHSTKNDCYLVVKNNVYDVSSYISSHPGGKQNITTRCGTEVTGIFAQIHSNKAWDLLAKYKIGTLAN